MNRAAGYKHEQTGIVNDRISNMINLYASGGIISTGEGMYAWIQALQSGKLIEGRVGMNELEWKSFIESLSQKHILDHLIWFCAKILKQ